MGKDIKAIRTKCLRCGKSFGITTTDMDLIGYTKYSYCEDCLREGLKLLKDRDEAEELRQPFYVIATGMGALQEYEGRPMAFKKRYTAECQIEETERLMRENGFKHLCGAMYIKPMTLEKCGKSKYHFCWLDKTIGELHRDVGKKYIIEIDEVDRERGRKQYDVIADVPTVLDAESED